jgi:kinesin family protein 1
MQEVPAFVLFLFSLIRLTQSTEIARGAECLIRIEGNQTIITKKTTSTPLNTNSRKQQHQQEDDVKAFTFDRSYWSGNKLDDHYADQELVYNDLGRELLDHAFDGYNCCIFACNRIMTLVVFLSTKFY